MKNFCFALSQAGTILLCALSIAGCGIGVVDTSISPIQTPGTAALQGSVYGGHAPIVGAEVFMLTPGVTGYYSKATDVSTNVALPTDAAFGYRYVTTTSGGFFSISGDYACTPNYPVFLAAYGGNPNTAPPVVLTAEAVSGTGPYTIKFTNQGYGLLYQGEVVTITGLTGSFAYLNGNQTVLGDTNLTSTTFDISVASNGGNATGSYTVGGSVSQATTSLNSNPGIVNMAVLGICPASGVTNFGPTSTSPINFVYMNEVSTVAAGYALAGFQSGAWNNIGIPAANTLALTGIQNATLTAGNLYDITGGSLGTATDGPDNHVARLTTAAGNGTVPQYLLNTLANILANCVDSNNTASTASSQCTLLFGYAKSAGTSGTTPTDIATAIFNMAHNPWANVTSLFNLPTGNVPFLPQLTIAPNDFSVGISYTGSLNGPFYSAVDGSGNIWVGNQGGQLGTTISKFSPLGAVLSGTGFTGGGLLDPYGIAVDVSGNVWTANYGTSTLSEFTSSGMAVSPITGYTGANLNGPYEIAFDKSGNLWTPNWGNASYAPPATISKFTSTGMAVGSYSGSGLYRGRDIAISASTIYVVNQYANTLSEFNVSTGAALNSGVTGGGLNSPTGVALDSAGNIWASNSSGNSISEFTTSGMALSPAAGYTGGGLNGSNYIAIDGANSVFVSNSGGNSISQFTNAGAAITNTSGYVATTSAGGSALNNPQHIVIDGSGNAWVVNFNSNRIVEYVGIGAPVVTPVVQALLQGRYGQKP